MNLEKIIEEVYNSGGGYYPANSEAPRKDFAPMSNRGGYENPYQQGGATNLPQEETPDRAPSLPWPLQTLGDDIADSFVFLAAGMTKISQATKTNPTIDKASKNELLEMYKKSKMALTILKDIGLSIGKLNLAKPQPAMNPVPINPDLLVDPKTLPNSSPTIAIKLP